LCDAIRERLSQLAACTGGVTLAEQFDGNLDASLQRFNAMAAAGKDLDFARGESAIEKA